MQPPPALWYRKKKGSDQSPGRNQRGRLKTWEEEASIQDIGIASRFRKPLYEAQKEQPTELGDVT
jgi:hypothetical protein